jgi:energy-coupling factor transporter ATP-binding protein EcfA2
MIDKVSCQDFKGQTFEYNIGQKTIITGPKGSGKSSISQAIQLSILGYIPSEKPKKRPMDIFSAFSSFNTKSFKVGVQQGKITYTKHFRRAPSGSVSIKYVVGTGIHSEVDYKAAIKELPQPYDLSIFMGLSDQKKIDTLFDLFPPAGNVIKLQAEIDACKDKKSAIEKSIDALKVAVAIIKKAKAEIELPSGTLAEIRQEINQTTAEWTLSSRNLHQAEAEAAETKRQEEAKKKAEKERQETPKTEQPAEAIRSVPQASNAEVYRPDQSRYSKDAVDAERKWWADKVWKMHTEGVEYDPAIETRTAKVSDSIRAIIDTMARTGCEACAATLVAKRELKKLQEGR